MASKGAIDQADVEEWKQRFTHELNNLSDSMKPAHNAEEKEWTTSIWDCFNPIDLCLISWCLPCVTFGKTYHREHKPDMKEYSAVNTSCLLLCGTGCFGVSVIPAAMQRAELRRKHNLKGDCLTDLFFSCCCLCCSLSQQEKESQALLNKPTSLTQYNNDAKMEYPPASAAPAETVAPVVTAPAPTPAPAASAPVV